LQSRFRTHGLLLSVLAGTRRNSRAKTWYISIETALPRREKVAHEATRVHIPFRRRGRRLAARGAGAAAGDAGDRVSQPLLAQRTERSSARISPGPRVIERIRQERQGTHLLDRVLNGAPGYDVHKPSGLEPRREQFAPPRPLRCR